MQGIPQCAEPLPGVEYPGQITGDPCPHLVLVRLRASWLQVILIFSSMSIDRAVWCPADADSVHCSVLLGLCVDAVPGAFLAVM